MNRVEYHTQAAAAMTERDLQGQVVKAAEALGWLCYHTWLSARSQAGFPDLVLVHPRQRRALYRELKRQAKSPTAAQQGWLDALTAAGQDAGVWRPLDWLEGRIQATLREAAR